MPVYTPTTWVSGTTPASAPNMNNIEGGVGGAYQKDGSDPATAALKVAQALAAADKVMLEMNATDGKKYQLIERNSDKALVLFNVTDSTTLGVFGPGADVAALTANHVPAPAFIGPIGSRPAAGSKWRLAFITPFS